jgi:hypothetical protein
MSKWPKPNTSKNLHLPETQIRRTFNWLKSKSQVNLYAVRRRISAVRQRISGARLCSDCFVDRGLGIEARKLGHESRRSCRNCHSARGAKLYDDDIEELARRFFVYGTWIRTAFGGASALQFNTYHHDKHEVSFPAWLESDARLIENVLGVGFFHYGPPLWRLGEIEPLKELADPASRAAAAARLVRRFPRRQLPIGSSFFRLRRDVKEGEHGSPSQYDAGNLRA